MYREHSELRREPLVYDGVEVGEFVHIAEEGELCEHIRFLAVTRISPGKEIGYHRHCGEKEIFHILEGKGEINDNGSIVNVSVGDVVVTPTDGWHGFKNTGEKDFAFMALVVKT